MNFISYHFLTVPIRCLSFLAKLFVSSSVSALSLRPPVWILLPAFLPALRILIGILLSPHTLFIDLINTVTIYH